MVAMRSNNPEQERPHDEEDAQAITEKLDRVVSEEVRPIKTEILQFLADYGKKRKEEGKPMADDALSLALLDVLAGLCITQITHTARSPEQANEVRGSAYSMAHTITQMMIAMGMADAHALITALALSTTGRTLLGKACVDNRDRDGWGK